MLTLLAMFDNLTVVKTYMLVRLSGIHVEGDTMRVTRTAQILQLLVPSGMVEASQVVHTGGLAGGEPYKTIRLH